MRKSHKKASSGVPHVMLMVGGVVSDRTSALMSQVALLERILSAVTRARKALRGARVSNKNTSITALKTHRADVLSLTNGENVTTILLMLASRSAMTADDGAVHERAPIRQ